jgi:Domain of unknown function (DUF4349)
MRLRKETPLDPETIRELEALDAALTGQPVDPRDEELASLAVAARSERPRPRPEFALDLDLRVRDGFPAPEPAQPSRPPRRVTAFRRRWALALGTAASVFIVVTAVLVSGGGDSGGGTDVPEVERTPAQAQDRAAGADSGGPAISPPVPPTSGIAPGARERKQELAASLTLSAPRDRIEDVANEAIRVTDRHGGFVLSSSVSAGEGRPAGATLDLRIPSSRLQRALADLSELGHVLARTQDTRDITGEFTSPRRRLADALAERRALLRQLARATTPNETTAIRARLRAVNRRIDRAQAELRRLRERVAFSSVAVAIEPGGSADGGGWTLGDAVDDALGVLRALLGGALVALAVLVPAAIVAAIGRLAYRPWLRRRRERALEM